MTIDRFHGEFWFLSNFAPASVRLGGVVYPTVEHAYAAAKTLDPVWRKRILTAKHAGQAKRFGREAPLRPDWDEIRLDVMRACLRVKFAREPYREKLLATGDALLVEGNYWGDRFWGVCDGVGENWLGRLLMEVRSDLRAAPPDPEGR